MVIFLDTTVVPPPPAVEAASSDGRLRLRLDEARGGIWAEATFTGTVEAIRIVRDTPTGSAPIHSGDPAPAVSGRAISYDHHTPAGSASYRAYALDRAGRVTASSTSATLVMPTSRRDAWLKPLRRPSLAMTVDLLLPDHQDPQETRINLQTVPGGSRAGTWDTPVPGPRTYRWLTETLAELDQARQIIASGELLVQRQPKFGEPDYWVLVTSFTAEHAGTPDEPERVIEIEVTPIEPPPTVGSPLRVPGLSHGDLAGLTLRQVWQQYPGFRSTSRSPAV